MKAFPSTIEKGWSNESENLRRMNEWINRVDSMLEISAMRPPQIGIMVGKGGVPLKPKACGTKVDFHTPQTFENGADRARSF